MSEQPVKKLNGIVRAVVKKGNHRAPAYIGQASGFVIDNVSVIVVANSIKDLETIAGLLGYTEFKPQRTCVVAVMDQQSIELEDNEL